MAHVQSTACYVMFNAGARFETPETNGVAHFVEHMLFCGTPRRPSVRALTGEVDAIGVLEVLDRPSDSQFTLAEMDLLGLFAHQAALALDLLRGARAARAVLAGEGELAPLARVAAALGESEETRAAGLRLLAALDELLRRR